MKKRTVPPPHPSRPGITSLLKPYTPQIAGLAALALATSGAGLIVPKIISHAIDRYLRTAALLPVFVWGFAGVAAGIFILSYLQSIMQTYVSERVAKDLRRMLAAKISEQSSVFIENITPSRVLTNLTSDVDSIKLFVAQAIVSIVSSVIIVIGAAALLLSIDWKLASAVLTVVPVIGVVFFVVLGKVRKFMLQSREVIDWLNKVINESILGSALIRVLNSQQPEFNKFVAANTGARNVGMNILRMFASLIPVIGFVANLATLIIVVLGGHFVIGHEMTLGDFTAFNSYLSLMIFPMLVIGMMSGVIAQATASYARIAEVLAAEEPPARGTVKEGLKGSVAVKNLTLQYGQKRILHNVSFAVPAGTKTAIIGPTAAGKTQLLYALMGLVTPQAGTIEYDGRNIDQYDKEALHRQVGLVFQDSIIFNMTVRENVAFSAAVTAGALQRALATAEIGDFIETLPHQLDTVVSERGTSLSGGQKQRIMLARALALEPKILLLDDFTARVDTTTERKILGNVAANYPEITLISITQKIASVERYDQIILLMEGEIIAAGTHQHLMATCPEYVQIYDSQRSTSHYE